MDGLKCQNNSSDKVCSQYITVRTGEGFHLNNDQHLNHWSMLQLNNCISAILDQEQRSPRLPTTLRSLQSVKSCSDPWTLFVAITCIRAFRNTFHSRSGFRGGWIATFCGHVPLILQPQGTSHAPSPWKILDLPLHRAIIPLWLNDVIVLGDRPHRKVFLSYYFPSWKAHAEVGHSTTYFSGRAV